MKSKLLRVFFLFTPFLIFAAFRTGISVFSLSDYAMVKYIAVFSLCAVVGLIVFQYKMKDESYFSYAVMGALAYFTSVIFFTDAAGAGFLTQESGIISFSLYRPESVLYVALFLMASVPQLIGKEPFTYYFAKQTVPDLFWGTRLFRVVNIVISFFWALIFALSFGAQFFNETVFSVSIPVILQLVVAVPATIFLVPFLQVKLAFVERGAPRDFLHSAEQALIGMPYVFDRQASGDLKAVIQFIITGTENIEAFLEISDGVCTYHEGVHPMPSMTMKSLADDYLKIARNEISGTDAFFRKMIEIEGDLSIALKMDKLFGIESSQVKEGAETASDNLNNKTDGDYINIPRRYFKMEPGEAKKVLLIQASPRKEGVSKTGILADAFLEGCRNSGAVTETVYLNECNINSCTGCYTCWTKTPGKCIFNDDVEMIMGKENDADLVVYASPLYIFGIVSSLKQYFDRRIPGLEPFLIDGGKGISSHPVRDGRRGKKNIAVLGVCGFPEVSHFDAVSAYYHHYSNLSGNNGFRIIAEIYRPASEIINNGFYADETARVLSLVRSAGEQIVKAGTVEKNIISGIAEVRVDKGVFRDQANKTWELCINEGKTLPQIQEEFAGTNVKN